MRMKKAALMLIVLVILAGLIGGFYLAYAGSSIRHTVVPSGGIIGEHLVNPAFGWEEKYLGDARITARYDAFLEYAPGRRVPNFIVFSFPEVDGRGALKDIRVYLWYSLFNASNRTPPRGMLALNDTVPHGKATGKEVFEVSFTYRFKKGLREYEYALNPAGGAVEFSTSGAGSLWTIGDINSFQDFDSGLWNP